MGECQIYTAANLKQIQTKNNAQNIVIRWKGRRSLSLSSLLKVKQGDRVRLGNVKHIQIQI